MTKEPKVLSLSDVARAAGVSSATASRALGDKPGVSAATRSRVLAVAAELQYVVSPAASQLATGSRGRVAVVVPHLSRWFFGALLEGLENGLRRAELDVLLYQVATREDREHFFERLPARRKVDAVVVLAFPVDEAEQQRLALMGVNILGAGGRIASYPCVSVDDHAAARQALDHLLFLGHRRIGMIAAVDPDSPEWMHGMGRTDAYYAALAEAEIEPDPQLVATVPWGITHGADAMAQLLSMRHPPTAVYAHSDEIAFGALATLRRAGVRVPEDMSVIGIDDHPLADLADLTTVAQPVVEQGELVAQLVIDTLLGEAVTAGRVLPTRLVVRGSTARPRGTA
ncbi:LacI family DNA-binding transcriptional regulator [Kocuria rosea]|uniref:LacI family DNA-binding transcriptional regulator n=1 Tax=Kocuria rosea TaxID=1275 RepID=UPI000DFC9965|nr:LacI family DNA-binding transcriptional regulator [Kocuria rosea]STX06489.1 HTH-type transcriptional repressor CytR [Kocuria rosea]